MRKAFALIAILLVMQGADAQEAGFERPDYGEIGKSIRKKNSDFFYKDLFDRYMKGDTALTLEQKRHLYYGYSFQPEYSPYGTSTYRDSLSIFLMKDTLTESDCHSVILFSGQILKENPFDVRALNYLAYSYHKLNNEERVDFYFNKLSLILDAIMSSGDGVTEETAFSVIYVAHEYDLLNALDLTFGGQQQLLKSGYDYLTLEPNEYGIDGFYFEISRCLTSLNKMFK